MSSHHLSSGSRRLAAGALLLGLLTATAAAQDPATLEISIDKPVLEAGDGNKVTLTVRGEPGHFPIIIVGSRRGVTPLADIGDVEVATDPTPYMCRAPRIPPSGEVSVCGIFPCDSPFTGAGPIYIQIVTFDLAELRFDQVSNLAVLQIVSGDCGECVEAAPVDSSAKYSGGHALWMPGIATDFVFTSGGDISERGDGTARMTGVVASESDPSKSFAIDVHLAGRIDPTDPSHPPAGSPKEELVSGAYWENGGPVDPTNWHYYEHVDGVLMGLDCFEGAVLSITRRGPAFQVGRGASGKNVLGGGSGWLDWLVLEQPAGCAPIQESGNGDINVDFGGECVECVEEASDHAITMKAFGDDFLFVSGGEFEELPDGTARIAGVIENDVDSANRWDVELVFSDKMMPGAASYPPAGSPKRELSSSSYVENGGVVDPDSWHYYLELEGHLTGLDGNTGLELDLTRNGPAFQVGLGANGKNEEYGGSGWLTIEHLGNNSTSKGDINIEIGECE